MRLLDQRPNLMQQFKPANTPLVETKFSGSAIRPAYQDAFGL